jgi:hypothetical protein
MLPSILRSPPRPRNLLLVYRILRSKPPSRFRRLISIDISPYVRLVWLCAQTPGMIQFLFGLCLALLQPTRPSSRALVIDCSRGLRLTFVQPGCTGKFVHPGCTWTANRIPNLTLIAGLSGSRSMLRTPGTGQIPTRGDDGVRCRRCRGCRVQMMVRLRPWYNDHDYGAFE